MRISASCTPPPPRRARIPGWSTRSPASGRCWQAAPSGSREALGTCRTPCFRCIPQVHGAAREALAYAQRQLAIELNASQENPLIVPEEQSIISVGNFDPIILAAALDFLRLALAPVVTSACERLIKLMQAPVSGLPEGLSDRPDFATTDFPQFAYVAAALAGEARSLLHPSRMGCRRRALPRESKTG